jgi:hypothetical protein
VRADRGLIQFGWALALVAFGIAPSALLASQDYRVNAALWVDGVSIAIDNPLLIGESPLILEADHGYRLVLAIQDNDPLFETLESVWLKVDIYQKMVETDGWDFVMDGLVGAPLGQKQVLALTSSGASVGPKSSQVYMEVKLENVP